MYLLGSIFPEESFSTLELLKYIPDSVNHFEFHVFFSNCMMEEIIFQPRMLFENVYNVYYFLLKVSESKPLPFSCQPIWFLCMSVFLWFLLVSHVRGRFEGEAIWRSTAAA